MQVSTWRGSIACCTRSKLQKRSRPLQMALLSAHKVVRHIVAALLKAINYAAVCICLFCVLRTLPCVPICGLPPYHSSCMDVSYPANVRDCLLDKDAKAVWMCKSSSTRSHKLCQGLPTTCWTKKRCNKAFCMDVTSSANAHTLCQGLPTACWTRKASTSP